MHLRILSDLHLECGMFHYLPSVEELIPLLAMSLTAPASIAGGVRFSGTPSVRPEFLRSTCWAITSCTEIDRNECKSRGACGGSCDHPRSDGTALFPWVPFPGGYLVDRDAARRNAYSAPRSDSIRRWLCAAIATTALSRKRNARARRYYT